MSELWKIHEDKAKKERKILGRDLTKSNRDLAEENQYFNKLKIEMDMGEKGKSFKGIKSF